MLRSEADQHMEATTYLHPLHLRGGVTVQASRSGAASSVPRVGRGGPFHAMSVCPRNSRRSGFTSGNFSRRCSAPVSPSPAASSAASSSVRLGRSVTPLRFAAPRPRQDQSTEYTLITGGHEGVWSLNATLQRTAGGDLWSVTLGDVAADYLAAWRWNDDDVVAIWRIRSARPATSSPR